MKKINLFCLPFAGGNKYSYNEFEKKAPIFLNAVTLEYSGRGGRMDEPLLTDIDSLINDLYGKIEDIIETKDYAFYGHSMGGLLSYLLTRKIIENNQCPPQHIFITGTEGPSAPSRKEDKKHLLGKVEFFDELKKYDGIPEEILQNEELLDFFEPLLRADFKAIENYIYKEHSPLDVPFTVITGTEEDMKTEEVYLWQKETVRTVDFRIMSGNHFFIFEHSHEILEIISKKLYKTPNQKIRFYTNF